MSDGNPDLRGSLRQALREGVGNGGHPTLEVLEAFHWGDLQADEADEVRAHLGECPRCLDLLARLDEIDADVTAAEVEVPEGELERSLSQVQARLRAEAEVLEDNTETLAGTPERLPAHRARLFPRWSAASGPYALAATVLLAGIGLSLWLATSLARERGRLPELESRLAAATARSSAMEEQLAEVRQEIVALEQQAAFLRQERDQILAPHPNTPIIDLRVSRERGGGDGEVEEIRIAPGVRFVTLVLEDPERVAHAAYRARLLDVQELQSFEVEGLRRTAYGNFVFTVSAKALPSGDCQILLEGRRKEQWTLLARYRVRLLR